MSTPAAVADRELYRWQLAALVRWLRCGRRGVIEAGTGSGKTDVAIAAAADALRRGLFVLVLVPSRVLMEQWHGRLVPALPPPPAGPPAPTRAGRPPGRRGARPAGGRRRPRPPPPLVRRPPPPAARGHR